MIGGCETLALRSVSFWRGRIIGIDDTGQWRAYMCTVPMLTLIDAQALYGVMHTTVDGTSIVMRSRWEPVEVDQRDLLTLLR